MALDEVVLLLISFFDSCLTSAIIKYFPVMRSEDMDDDDEVLTMESLSLRSGH